MPAVPPSNAGLHRRLWIWAGYWLVLFVGTHVPVTRSGPLNIRNADKVLHFTMFFALTLLGAQYWRVRGRLSTPAIWIWAVGYIAYAALDEWLQQFVGRSNSLADFLADAGGVLAASILLQVNRPARRLSEPGDVGTGDL